MDNHKRLIIRFVEELWNQRDLAVADDLFHPECRTFQLRSGAPATPEPRGPDAIKAHISEWLAGFPDLRFTIEKMIAEGDKVSTLMLMEGTHTGEWSRIPPNGKRITIRMMTIHRIQHGKIIEDWVIVESLGFFQQLGVLPETMDFLQAFAHRSKRSVEAKTVVWKGILYNSLEYCKLTGREDGCEAKSKIIGSYFNNTFAVSYEIVINNAWEVLHFNVEYEINEIRRKIIGEKTGLQWKLNGSIDPRYANFSFIDISLTPFTNTLPVRNLNLDPGQEREIDVIYIDILENDMLPAKQRYRKEEDGIFRYQNVPNDFEAKISVDEFGLVTNYPLLFERQR